MYVCMPDVSSANAKNVCMHVCMYVCMYVIRCRSLHRMQLHVSLCGTTVDGSSLENSALSGKLELKLRSW